MTKSEYVFKRGNIIIDTLRERKGRENAISSEELNNIISKKGYSMNIGALRAEVKRLMYERHTPICFANGKGYYLPNCKSDIEAVIEDLTHRAEEMTRHADFLKGFIF